MGLSIIRILNRAGVVQWALVEGEHLRVLEGAWETTGAFLEEAVPALRAGSLKPGASQPLSGVELLSPVTHPCRVLAQSTNYAAHAEEAGIDARARGNVLFQKSSRSLSAPSGGIVRPAHVRLLDYEIELGIVVGARIRGPVSVDADSLHRYVGALVVANDVSARDIQVPDGQFYRGKSYGTFTPCGPVLYVPEPEELARWRDLVLELRVNGEVRQRAHCGDMINGPAETLSELSTLEDLDPGDLLLTGTPGGVALAPPGRWLQAAAGLLPERVRWKLFVRGQARRREYLKPGDLVSASIRIPGGAMDLGRQELLVRQ